MKILSLFDGVSCARLALERAGVEVAEYFASEIDKYAIKVTQANRPDTIQLGSVTDVHLTDAFDLLIGGSPCQDLSIAKKDRQGLEGSRSSLFYEYVRILNEVKPRYFILENVASMRKADQDTITKELFGIESVMINASLVSAQNRKRLFWVGKLVGDTYEQVKIEQPEDRQIYLKDILEDDVDEKYLVNINDKYKLKGLCDLEGKSKSMTASMHKGYGNDGCSLVSGCASRTCSRIKISGKPRSKRIETRNDGEANNLTSVQSDSMIRIGQIGKGGQGDKTGSYFVGNNYNKKVFTSKSGTLGTTMGRTAKQGMAIYNKELSKKGFVRKLTPIECERLQSMPDNWTNPTGDISNTQRYKMCGNAFNVDVVAHIIKHLDL